MDWIQIYLVVFLITEALMQSHYHGTRRTKDYNFFMWLFGMALLTPVWGRVLGAW